ncbi:MAG: ABC transporter ATP-binding protein [Peptococcaceae bacterium]|nr:ABC transporter ATP-binding protein [Peptococcaceae bacterium]
MQALTIRSLKKSFKNVHAIINLDMNVPENSVYGFLGKNGAGKTTTMKIITGLLKSDGGEIEVFGQPARFGETKVNRMIGYLPDVPEFYGYMTSKEYLSLCAKVSGVTPAEAAVQIKELIAVVGLKGINRRIKTYSRGMKQRLGIAQALIGSPKLILCDEPTSALDPEGRLEVLQVLNNLRERVTVVFSTHILADVERICDRVGVLNNGCLAMEKSISELQSMSMSGRIRVETYDEDARSHLLDSLGQLPGFKVVVDKDTTFFLEARDTKEAAVSICKTAADLSLPLRRLERLEQSLEDVFMEVTGQ